MYLRVKYCFLKSQSQYVSTLSQCEFINQIFQLYKNSSTHSCNTWLLFAPRSILFTWHRSNSSMALHVIPLLWYLDWHATSACWVSTLWNSVGVQGTLNSPGSKWLLDWWTDGRMDGRTDGILQNSLKFNLQENWIPSQ